ncbi:MAG: metal-dependent hydrolase [Chloroflexi bacterium]|nr:MAG: metal-dependent hydrolase [Chloroflexota bacterium]
MAQAGLHALSGVAVGKVVSRREWFFLGLILGTVFPDLDNYVVAAATIAKLDTHGLHRTFTHSLFTILAVMVIFFLISRMLQQPRWANLGLGLGAGIGMHIALDLLIWFNSVELLWPLGGWVNLWEDIQPPAWFATLLQPLELLFLALYFGWLGKTARNYGTNLDFLGTLRVWTILMVVFLLVFTPLAFIMGQRFLIIFGVVYLISITAAVVITVRMRQTVEAWPPEQSVQPATLAK